MIDIKLKYQASFFADIKSIKPTSETISILLETFRDKEFIPNIIQELGSPELGFEPRVQLTNLRGEWAITFGTNRVNIEKFFRDEKGNNIGTLENFCSDINEFYKRIYERFDIKSNRLALVTTYLLEEMSRETLDAAYTNIADPIQIYIDNPPFEWAARAAAKTPIRFIGMEEIINVLTTISRAKMEMNLPDKIIPLDRIQVQLDINTNQESSNSRFDKTNTNEFYKAILPIHNTLLSEVEDKIHG